MRAASRGSARTCRRRLAHRPVPGVLWAQTAGSASANRLTPAPRPAPQRPVTGGEHPGVTGRPADGRFVGQVRHGGDQARADQRRLAGAGGPRPPPSGRPVRRRTEPPRPAPPSTVPGRRTGRRPRPGSSPGRGRADGPCRTGARRPSHPGDGVPPPLLLVRIGDPARLEHPAEDAGLGHGRQVPSAQSSHRPSRPDCRSAAPDRARLSPVSSRSRVSANARSDRLPMPPDRVRPCGTPRDCPPRHEPHRRTGGSSPPAPVLR